jgi:hypothetical protein
MLGSSGLRLSRHTPIELDYIRYRWVGDLEKMDNVMKFVPVFSAKEALRELADEKKGNQLPQNQSAAEDEGKLDQIIEHRKNSRDMDGGDGQIEIAEGKEGDGHE